MRFENSIAKRLAGKHKANLKMIDFRDKKILDIGCGIGIFEKWASRKARRILAIDINKKDLEIARKEVKDKNIKFEYGSIFDKNFNKKFDIITLFDVIEHFPEEKEIEALNKIHNILEKGGKLLVSSPCSNFSMFFDIAWYFGHRHYTKKRLYDILDKTGFKIEKIYKRGGFYEILSMMLFYPFKWFLNLEVPFKKFLDTKRDKEYEKDGFVTWFVIAVKK